MSASRVSILMPTYNNAHTIGAAIQSVLDQTYAHWELVIVDDGSGDDTPQIVTQVADPRVLYIRQNNRGASAARNLAIARSTGDYIAFLDADDLFDPRKLEVQVNQLDRYPEIGLSYVSRIEIDQDGTPLSLVQQPADASLLSVIVGFPFAPSDLMVRRPYLKRAGDFDTSLIVHEDRDLYVRLALSGCKFVGTAQFLAMRRLYAGKPARNLVRQEENIRHVLSAAFDDPRFPNELLSFWDRAWANAYLPLAYEAAAQGETQLAHAFFRSLLHHDPSILGREGEGFAHYLVHAATRNGGDHETALDQVFAQLPPEMASFHRQRAWTIARGYLVTGARHLLWNRIEPGKTCLAHAAKAGAAIDDRFLQDLTQQLLNFAVAFGPDSAQAAVRRIVRHLPLAGNHAQARHLHANFSISQAFLCYQQEQPRAVLSHIAQAVLNDPKLAANRGVASMLAHTILRIRPNLVLSRP